VLDMGEQIKVLDMARNLIRLAGLVPEEEIPIVFVGLRPGEKLHEELVGTDETVQPSGVAKIFQVRAERLPDPEALARQLTTLERLALQGEAGALLDFLSEVIPTFRPQQAVHRDDLAWEHAANML
jgi:FlaA1/EpsC-like NDP-sugar epimerase